VEEIEAKGASIRSTAKKFSLDRKTLGRALNRKRDGKKVLVKIGRPPVLSKEEEAALIHHVQTTTLQGRVHTDKSLAIVIAAGKKKNQPLSRKYVKGLCERNKDKVVKRIDKKDDQTRREAFTVKNMGEFYSSLGMQFPFFLRFRLQLKSF
tara:strand:- start:2164 stop:2616 length:453 start_codon:yes stop_codon:yes gene_type:complete